MKLAYYLKAIATLCLISLLAACNGSSDKAANNDTLSLVLKDPNGIVASQFPVNSQFTAEVTLTSAGTPVADTTVNIQSSTSFAVVSSSATTGADGKAEVTVELSSGIADSATLTATASINGQQKQSSQSFTPLDRNGNPLAEVSIQLLEVADNSCTNAPAGPSLSQFHVFCIRATLSRDGQPLSQTPVSFTAPIGSLSQDSRLTDGQGIAEVIVTNDAGSVGAGTLSASVDDASATVNYEYRADFIEPAQPNILSIKIIQDTQEVTRLTSGETYDLAATLTDHQQLPLTNEIISFSVGLGNLPVTTALTDQDGTATIRFTPADTDIGASTAQVSNTQNENILSASSPYEVVAANIPTETFLLGYWQEGMPFQESVIKPDVTEISAGGTAGLTVHVVNQTVDITHPVTTPAIVTFSSNCHNDGLTRLSTSVTTLNGVARATYEDLGCSVSGQVEDTIEARLDTPEQSLSATTTLTIQAEQLGSINFVSATPETIVIKGSGGQNTQESSVLRFRVVGAQSNPLPQRQVTFSLDTDVGGITLGNGQNTQQITTNSDGEASVIVNAGRIPTAVRVTAQITEGDIALQTQSDLLSINTGLPDQDSMTIAADILNPEAGDYSGNTVNVTAWLADSFNNPVPDGTTINFTAEGGDIEGSCNTTGGSCSVVWEGVNPRPDNHRVTIMASAIGHESFTDNNGDGLFTNGDGVINKDKVSEDLSEAWRDDNENGNYDLGEFFLDYNNNKAYDGADNLFTGPQCDLSVANNVCSTDDKLHVFKSMRLIMSGSNADYRLTSDNGTSVYIDDINGDNTVPVPALAAGANRSFALDAVDDEGQVLPAGTTVTVASTVGTLTGTTSIIVSNRLTAQGFSFTLENTLDPATPGQPAQTAQLTITTTTPAGFITQSTLPITLSGT